MVAGPVVDEEAGCRVAEVPVPELLLTILEGLTVQVAVAPDGISPSWKVVPKVQKLEFPLITGSKTELIPLDTGRVQPPWVAMFTDMLPEVFLGVMDTELPEPDTTHPEGTDQLYPVAQESAVTEASKGTPHLILVGVEMDKEDLLTM